MADTKINVSLDISSLIGLMQNNIIISLIGIGSVLLAIVKLIQVLLKHYREKDKEANKQRKKEYKNLKTILSQFYNKETALINEKLSKNNISFAEIMDASNKIHELYIKDNKLFISQSSLFDKKIYEKIKQKNVEYRYHISPSNAPGKNIDTNISEINIENITKLSDELSDEINKLPIYVKKQFNLYLEFNKLFADELSNIQKKLAKKLGL